MDFRDLVYFEKIVEFGHLGHAADTLGRTKPALTKCIRRLEDDIDAALFRREGRRIILTDVGEVLYRKAREMRIAMEEMAYELKNHTDGFAGHIRIGAGPTTANYHLPQILDRLVTNAPKISTEIIVDIGEKLRTYLTNDQLDLIITTILPGDSENFQVWPIAVDEVVIVASNEHPLHRFVFKANDLLDYKWILPDRTAATRHWIDSFFLSRTLERPCVQIETNSLHLLSTLMRNNPVLGFIPRSNLLSGGIASALAEITIPEAIMKRQIGILYRKNQEISSKVSLVMRIVRETLMLQP